MKKIHKLENDRINKNGYFSNGLNWNLRQILKEDLNIKHIYYRRKKKKKIYIILIMGSYVERFKIINH